MSTTDQAFIRAYQQEIAVGKPTPALQAAMHLQAALADSDAALPAATSGDPAASSSPLTTLPTEDATGNAAAGEPKASDWQNTASVQVGLGSVVPPPHANFAGVARAPAEASASQERAPSTAVPVRIDTRHDFRRDAAALRTKLKQSPKASLSSFVESIVAAARLDRDFCPALEIDAVRWPPVCEALLAQHAEQFDRLIHELQAEAQAGRQVTAITGIDRGEGRTTFAICLAKQMSKKGLKLALVDADFAAPQLALQLGLEVSHGWETMLAGDQALAEVMIESMRDKVAIVPLGQQVVQRATAPEAPPMAGRISATMDELKLHFDLILVDAGPLGTAPATPHWLTTIAHGIDSVIVAHDLRRGAAHHLAAACLQLADAGANQLGIAEMFVAEK